MPRNSVPAALLVGGAAFALYRATMLPGVEFGDSASFQVMVGSAVVTPRDGYPLYFAIADLLHWFVQGDPARVLNLASALHGAIACGVIVLVAAELSGSAWAGAAAALMFAGSYTFWSQSVIAEVYALHMLLVALTLWLLLRWSSEPTFARLAAFFIAYAASFGNHLTMVLLAPAYALFMFLAAPGGWRAVLTPRVMALAVAAAAIGAMPYAWNLHGLWLEPTPPATWGDALATFWFDVTKADWRDTMILAVPVSMAVERLRMYVFDVAQQFGFLVPALAAVGLVAMMRGHKPRLALLAAAYLVNVLFALCYNVGDSHVFFVASHLMLSLLAAPGIVFVGQFVASPPAVLVTMMVLTGARMYRDFPALDRSADRRPADTLEAITSGLDDRHDVLVADLNWQVQNGLNYLARHLRDDVAYARLPDVALYAPALVRDNLAIGRAVVATPRAQKALDAAYGPLLTATLDQRTVSHGILEAVRELPQGTRYVICSLRPSREFTLDNAALEETLRLLTAGRLIAFGPHEYAAAAGVVGDAPLLIKASGRPFRDVVDLAGLAVHVRMESWLAFDTIRRMGFGQVVAGRYHALVVERGMSFVAFDSTGRVLRSSYEGNIFAAQPRYLLGFTRAMVGS